eukprot:15435506-Alexandrium_andersonii.AAC.1
MPTWSRRWQIRLYWGVDKRALSPPQARASPGGPSPPQGRSQAWVLVPSWPRWLGTPATPVPRNAASRGAKPPWGQ